MAESTVLHLLAGIALLWAVNRLVDGQPLRFGILAWRWLGVVNIWVSLIGRYFIISIAVIILFSLGEVVHRLLLLVLRMLIGILDWVERRTAAGSVGIVGFALLFIGFAIQMFANYVA